MGGLPDDLRQALYAALLATPYFASYSALLPLFIDERLYPWRAGLPQRDTPAGLTQATIDYLYPLHHQQHGSALLALLQVIHTALPEGDAARSRLAALIERARPGLAAPPPPPDLPTTHPTPEQPMSQPYNLAVVRQLLAAAFSAGEISTLAFDLFPSVFQDFAAGMTRAQKIEMVVAYAERNGGVDDLVGYVQRVNRYQYNRFAGQLRPGPQQERKPMPDYAAQRLQDLQEHIARERDLLNQYEEQLSYTTDPRQIKRIEAEIARQKRALAGYQQEARDLQAELPTAVAGGGASAAQQGMADVTGQLNALSQQLQGMEQRLADGQEAIRRDLAGQHAAILAHIDAAHQQTLQAVVARLNTNQSALVELLLDAADKQEIAQWEAQNLTLLTQQALVDLHQLRQAQPDAGQWQSLLAVLEKGTTWEQKLKLTIPLIPGLLEFESEANIDVMGVLNESWRRLLARLRR